MLDKFIEVLGNSHFEAYIGGPIAGAVVGLMFAGFGKTPQVQQSHLTPHILQIQVTVPASERKARDRSGSDSNILPAAILLALLLVFLFAAYLPKIAFAFYFLVATVAAFSISSSLLALVTGQFNTPAWWLQTISPILTSAGSWYIASMVERSISPDVVAYAQSLLGNQSITFAGIVNGAFYFFRQVGSAYMQWMTFQMGALAFAAMAALTAFLQCMHFFALSNLRSSNSAIWQTLALRTFRFSSFRSTLINLLFIGIAYFLASGHAYRFFQS